ncbi:hypothetical protein [Psychroflexus longus]|nr:hypothetical protein [Psychroflexus longus]
MEAIANIRGNAQTMFIDVIASYNASLIFYGVDLVLTARPIEW